MNISALHHSTTYSAQKVLQTSLSRINDTAQGNQVQKQGGNFDRVTIKKNHNPLQDIISSLKERISSIRSNTEMNSGSRDSMIKSLEEQIKTLQEQMLKEQQDKAGGDIKKNSNNEEHELSEKLSEELKSKGFQVVDQNLLEGLNTASGIIERAEVHESIKNRLEGESRVLASNIKQGSTDQAVEKLAEVKAKVKSVEADMGKTVLQAGEMVEETVEHSVKQEETDGHYASEDLKEDSLDKHLQ